MNTDNQFDIKSIKSFLRSYKILVIIFVAIPIILCVVCYFSVPFFNKAGSSAWLSFWGGYLGSTIMAGVTLHVLEKQVAENHKESEQNRQKNTDENNYNRELSSNLRLQEIELKWFDDLKQACSKLYSAFSSNEVVIVSDLEPLSDDFHNEVTRLINRMNEAYFNFQLVINYHRNIVSISEANKIQHLVEEYLALLSDMQGLHIYGILLKEGLEEIDYSPEELETRFKGFILKRKREMEFPDISENRVWNLLIDGKFDKLEYIPQILTTLRQRIDNFNMLIVGEAITELVKKEYRKVMEILTNDRSTNSAILIHGNIFQRLMCLT